MGCVLLMKAPVLVLVNVPIVIVIIIIFYILFLAFRCKDYSCVASAEDCARGYNTFSSVQLERTFLGFEETQINFAYSEAGILIGKLVLPANSILLASSASAPQTSADLIHTLQIYPVADSLLQSVTNTIPESQVEYLARIYPLSTSN